MEDNYNDRHLEHLVAKASANTRQPQPTNVKWHQESDDKWSEQTTTDGWSHIGVSPGVTPHNHSAARRRNMASASKDN
jgi:hypothetical protein